jgi:hypothetical protein
VRWFRREQQDPAAPIPREGIPIDLKRYESEIGEGSRGDVPHDHYWLMMADVYDDEVRLLWEKSATEREAKRALKVFEQYCRVKPQRVNQFHTDNVGGIWVAPQPGRTIGMLSIWPPNYIGVARRLRDKRWAVGINDDPELVGGDWDDPEWGEWWDRRKAAMIHEWVDED